MLINVNEARLELFCRDNKTTCMENNPPTAEALLQHMLQGEQPSRLVSGQKHTTKNTYIPEFCGWTCDECNKKWVPVWITLPMANKACQELLKCGSKRVKGCGAMPDAAARKLTSRVLNFVNVVVYVKKNLPAVNSCYIITIIT